MMARAHGRTSSGPVGRQEKMLRRLGVSETPVTLAGPLITRSRMWGGMVSPYPMPIWVSAMLCPCAEKRSSTGPRSVGMKTAETRWGPARTWMGPVSRIRPLPPGSTSPMKRSTGSSATCSPSIEMSTCLARLVTAEEVAFRGVMEGNAELVGAVGGEVVHHRGAAARPIGRPGHPLTLGGEPRESGRWFPGSPRAGCRPRGGRSRWPP